MPNRPLNYVEPRGVVEEYVPDPPGNLIQMNGHDVDEEEDEDGPEERPVDNEPYIEVVPFVQVWFVLLCIM